ncbi:polysaccharide deacetylase family protein [Flavobacterium chilense]|uniref:polysaccharide deacetylase family protein n=1 Tax=Flavobacterium chilense TaxID=946677 RepID=UPI00138F5ACC|nr:polysaccharide deacetylase family protein [Flavobacterium chilense]
MTPSEFKQQLILLKNQGNFVHPNDLILDLNAVLQSKDNNLLITFDDGLKEQFDLALPILDELNIPAVFFVNSINSEEKKVTTVHKIHLLRSIISSSEFLDKFIDVPFSQTETQNARNIYRYDDEKSAVLKYILNFKLDFKQQEQIVNTLFNLYFEESVILESLYMTEQNLKELANKGYLGSHTHSHYPLGLLDSETIKKELKKTKTYLDTLTHSNIKIVSYPYGTPEVCTDQVADLTQKAGYEIGFTTKRGINTLQENPLLLNRFDCNDLIGGKNYNKI